MFQSKQVISTITTVKKEKEKENNNNNKKNYCYTHGVTHNHTHRGWNDEIMFQKHNFIIITKIIRSKQNFNCTFHTYNAQLLLEIFLVINNVKFFS